MEHNAAPIIMRNKEIVGQLRQIKAALYTLREGIQNRKGMRDSERAMTMGTLTRQMKALDAAADRVLLRNDQMPLVVHVLEHVARPYVEAAMRLSSLEARADYPDKTADLKTIDDALASARIPAHTGAARRAAEPLWPGPAAKA